MLEEMKRALKKDKRYFSKRELKRQADVLNYVLLLNYYLAVGVTSVICIILSLCGKLDNPIGMGLLTLWGVFLIISGIVCVDRLDRVNKQLKNFR